MTHTPGPWQIETKERRENPLYVMDVEGNRIARCDGLNMADFGPGPDQCKANARLIAAAPQLLAAAKEAAEKLNVLLMLAADEDPTCQKLSRAIDEAEGRTSVAEQSATLSEGVGKEAAHADPLVRHVREGLLPKLRESALCLSLVPRDAMDVKFIVETGAAILLDKPIVAIIQPGTPVSGKFAKVVDRFIAIEDMDNPDSKAALRAAIEETLAQIRNPPPGSGGLQS